MSPSRSVLKKVAVVEHSLAEHGLHLVVERVRPLGEAVVAGAVEIALVGQVLRDQDGLGPEAGELVGQPEQEPVVHVLAVRGVEPEPVDVVLGEEHLAGVDQQVLHVTFLGGDPVAPRRVPVEVQAAVVRPLLVRALEDRLPQRVHVVAGVVEDLVQQDGQAVLVRRVHQLAQVVGGAEVTFDRREYRGAVAQGSGPLHAGELGERHQGERVDPQLVEVALPDPLGDPGEPALLLDPGVVLGEAVDAELVDDQVGSVGCAEVVIGPRVPAGVDDHRVVVAGPQLTGERVGAPELESA